MGNCNTTDIKIMARMVFLTLYYVLEHVLQAWLVLQKMPPPSQAGEPNEKIRIIGAARTLSDATTINIDRVMHD